ncbi:MAG: serine/threonine protein kinase [Pseudohongiellaceae bacterium]
MTQEHPFATLSPDLVINAVESTGVISDARILALNSYENRVYQVGVENGEPLIVKFYRPGRWTREQILEEHAFSLELAGLEIPVVPPQADTAGNTLQEYQGFQFAIFERRGGRSPDLDDPANLEVMGRFLGRIHKVGALRAFRYRRSLAITDFAEASAAYLLENGFIPLELRQAYDSVASDLIRRLHDGYGRLSGIKPIRLHGDCHMGNVLWRDGTPHFVDFDDTMSGPAIQDLWMLLSGEREEKTAQFKHLMNGYSDFFEFNPLELHLLEALRTMRIMHYSAWLARRWDDPAFPVSFPWFNTEKYWAGHILELREQQSAMEEPPLELY